MIINTGRWSEAELNSIMRQSSMLRSAGEKVELISRQFLGTAYRESTLTGDIDRKEAFVINLGGVDCFTFLDYVEAMRISESFNDFKKNVRKVRYQEGVVSFQRRNHFFTDWREYNADLVDDVTGTVGGSNTRRIFKMLNLKENGSGFLRGLEVRSREICFISSSDIDGGVIGRLRSGDYAGIYSQLDGLDVSHAGIIVKEGGRVCLRHASSRDGVRKVVDEDFRIYIADRPGLVVLRPKHLPYPSPES